MPDSSVGQSGDWSVGDRVLIVGDHPWAGHTGEIREPFANRAPLAGALTGLEWVVDLDNGHSCSTDRTDMTRLDR